jgi:hypothetical protein
MRGAALLATVIVALSPARPSVALTLAIDTSNLFVGADSDGELPRSVDQVLPASLPSGGSLYASEGDASSSMVFDLTDGGFAFAFEQILSATHSSDTNNGNHVAFRSDVDVAYVLSASFTSISATPIGITMGVSLLDGEVCCAAPPIYRSVQVSESSAGESFVLGGAGGDLLNLQEGSSTGVLEAGHLYILAFDFSQEGAAGTSPGLARGSLNLTLVPEPGTAWLFALAVAASSLARARGRGRAPR